MYYRIMLTRCLVIRACIAMAVSTTFNLSPFPNFDALEILLFDFPLSTLMYTYLGRHMFSANLNFSGPTIEKG